MGVSVSGHGHGNESVLAELLELLGNPAHWIFEGISDLVLGVILYPLLRIMVTRWQTRHDQEVHEDTTPLHPKHKFRRVGKSLRGQRKCDTCGKEQK